MVSKREKREILAYTHEYNLICREIRWGYIQDVDPSVRNYAEYLIGHRLYARFLLTQKYAKIDLEEQ